MPSGLAKVCPLLQSDAMSKPPSSSRPPSKGRNARPRRAAPSKAKSAGDGAKAGPRKSRTGEGNKAPLHKFDQRNKAKSPPKQKEAAQKKRQVVAETQTPSPQRQTKADKAQPRKAPSELRPNADGEQRIAKLMARAGIASRRQSEAMIAEGRVKLNGATVTTPATLLKSLAGVTVDDQPVAPPEQTRMFLFHKPAGCLTAERDPAGRKTIYDVLPKDLPRVMPIGRLDLNTEGLLLLTNDGEFKRMMELPATGVERTYRARAFGDVSQDQLEGLIQGITIDGIHYGRIDANLERRTGRNQWVEMKLTEGKNREVRRVLEHLGLKVSRLIRTSYGPFRLGDLEKGEVGEVAERDLARFIRTLESKPGRKRD